jgi:hypothetical protein
MSGRTPRESRAWESPRTDRGRGVATRVAARNQGRRTTDPGSRRLAMVMLALLATLVSAIVGMLILQGGASDPVVAGAEATQSPSPPSSSPVTTSGPTSPPVAAPPSTFPTDPAPTFGPTAPATVAPTQAPASAPPTPAPSTSTPKPVIPVDATLDAALARCPTADEIALVDSRIRLTFVDDPTGPKLVCRARDGSADLTRLQERAYQAVLSMRRIRFDAPLPWTERSMFGWFTRAVTGVQFQFATYSYCCTRDRDIVIRSQMDMSYLLDNHWVARGEVPYGLMGVIGLMAHEARHAEGYLHTCGSSDDETVGYIDDATLEEMGGWGVNYWWLVWLTEHTDREYMTPVDAPADLYEQTAHQDAEGIYGYRICANYQ